MKKIKSLRSLSLITMFSVLTLGLFIFSGQSVKAGADLVAHWNFDEGSGTVLNDVVGGADGVISGATWINGYSGNALTFNGLDDYVEITTMPGEDVFTLMYRVKANEPIIGGRITSVTFDRFDTEINDDGSLMLHMKDSGWIDANCSIGSGSWTFLAFSFDGSTVKIYKNATLVKTMTTTGFLPGDYMRFGSRFKDYHREESFSNISLDEVKIYNFALSQEEITEEYQNNSLCTEDTWECGEWDSCSSNGIQARNCTKTYDCSLVDDNPPETTQSCMYEAPVCTDWNYSDWSDCTSEGIQSRSVIESMPSNCEGGNSTLSQKCNYIPISQIDGTEINYTGDLNLTLNNNPYIVNHDLVIYPGETIKIQKGVSIYFAQDAGVCFQNGECLKYGWSGLVPDIAGKKLIFTDDVNIVLGNEIGNTEYKIVSHSISSKLNGDRPEGEKGIFWGTCPSSLKIINQLSKDIKFSIHSDWFSTFLDVGIIDEYWGWNFTVYSEEDNVTSENNPVDYSDSDVDSAENNNNENEEKNTGKTEEQAPTTNSNKEQKEQNSDKNIENNNENEIESSNKQINSTNQTESDSNYSVGNEDALKQIMVDIEKGDNIDTLDNKNHIDDKKVVDNNKVLEQTEKIIEDNDVIQVDESIHTENRLNTFVKKVGSSIKSFFKKLFKR